MASLLNWKDGKDVIMWVTQRETRRKIDWDCPCLQGVKDGPCGTVIIESMKCFEEAETEQQSMGCAVKFAAMRECMKKYPVEYKDFLEDK